MCFIIYSILYQGNAFTTHASDEDNDLQDGVDDNEEEVDKYDGLLDKLQKFLDGLKDEDGAEEEEAGEDEERYRGGYGDSDAPLPQKRPNYDKQGNLGWIEGR